MQTVFAGLPALAVMSFEHGTIELMPTSLYS